MKLVLCGEPHEIEDAIDRVAGMDRAHRHIRELAQNLDAADKSAVRSREALGMLVRWVRSIEPPLKEPGCCMCYPDPTERGPGEPFCPLHTAEAVLASATKGSDT